MSRSARWKAALLMLAAVLVFVAEEVLSDDD